jgi:hypothetical protein
MMLAQTQLIILETYNLQQNSTSEGFQWLCNPFTFSLPEKRFTTKQNEEFIDISKDAALKGEYSNLLIKSD